MRLIYIHIEPRFKVVNFTIEKKNLRVEKNYRKKVFFTLGSAQSTTEIEAEIFEPSGLTAVITGWFENLEIDFGGPELRVKNTFF